MNKILVDNNINLDSKYIFDKDYLNVLEIDNITKKIDINVLENINVKLTIIGKNNNLNLNIRMNKNSNLTLSLFTIDGTINIDTNLYEASSFKLNNSILSSIDSNNTITVNHLEDRSISDIKNHGYSVNSSKLVFNVEGKIIASANKCECHQDNQIIENENSLSTILPKLYIDNYDVEASHSAYVGEFKENDLFYLMSRGISLEDSKFLLLNAFLIGIFDFNDDYKSKLKDIILNYFNKEV